MEEPARTPESGTKGPQWLPLYDAVTETAKTTGRPVAWARRAVEKAIQEAVLTIRGVPVGNEDHSAHSEASIIAAGSLRDVRAARSANAGTIIEWHNGESPPELRILQGRAAGLHADLEILRDRFEAWLLMMKG